MAYLLFLLLKYCIAKTPPSTHIYLRLLLPNKTLQEFDITAPKMNVGGKYELRFKYEEMQPKMNLEATINGWTNLKNEVEIK